jgi:hypothetical protein
VGRGFGHSIKFLTRFVVHWMEFLRLIGDIVLEWEQVLLILHKIGSFLDNGCCLCKIVLIVDLY